MYALVDCNSFYASCEQVFCPAARDKPVVVLSNNDGNVVSRTREAKALGIPMGAPYFEWKNFLRQQRVFVFSNNSELYNDMSQRIMNLLAEYCADLEIYSVDEAFLYFANTPLTEIHKILATIARVIPKGTGIPISIGLAKTKTLAKIANLYAKQQQLALFSFDNTAPCHNLLKNLLVQEVWGVGSKLSLHFNQLGIHTAEQLKHADTALMRKRFSVVVEKIIYELRGVSCLTLESVQPRQQIIYSRSFGHPLTDFEELQQAISHFVARAAVKLRQQHSVAQGIEVYLQTNLFLANYKRAVNNASRYFAVPSQDTADLIREAKHLLPLIYHPQGRYHKAGVILLEISSADAVQADMLSAAHDPKKIRLMHTMDKINQQMGEKTIFHAAQGTKTHWQAKKQFISQRYTTRWNELPIVK